MDIEQRVGTTVSLNEQRRQNMASIRYIARVEDDGSLTLPHGALEELGAKPGDELEIALQPLPPLESGSDNGHSDESKPLADLFKDRVGRLHFDPADLSVNTGERFADLLVEKFQSERTSG
jgi:hypothetical protein